VRLVATSVKSTFGKGGGLGDSGRSHERGSVSCTSETYGCLVCWLATSGRISASASSGLLFVLGHVANSFVLWSDTHQIIAFYFLISCDNL
jgi:hypothetical protein